MDALPEESADFNTVHDFLNERLALKVLGCYNVLNKSKLHYVMNMVFLGSVFMLYVYMLMTCVYTLTIPDTEPAFKVQVFQTFSLMSVVFAVPSLSFYYNHNYKTAINLLKSGIDRYSNEEPDAQHRKFKEKRVKQVRLWSLILGVLCYLVAIFFTLRPPFMYIFVADNDNPKGIINKYLPLPLYVPFSTAHPLGFAVAFLSNSLYLFLLYTTLTCFVEAYLSSVLQLVAQIEIFNYSLQNLQNRACLKFKLDNFSCPHDKSLNSEGRRELQKNLYHCLRTSLQHHQAIMRYYQEVRDYIGAMNTFSLLVFALVFASSIVTVIQDPLGNMALIFHLMNEVTGYFQIFLVGQVILDKSSDSMMSLYSTPWADFNKKCNSMLHIMLTMAKKPMILRAPFFNADWTLETFGVMLSGAYKLVNLLMNTVS